MCNLVNKFGTSFRLKTNVVLLPVELFGLLQDLKRELSPDDAANLGHWLIVHASCASELIKDNTKESIKSLAELFEIKKT